jgi:hypothetical protein
VPLAPGAPFDWGELALATLLLALAAAAAPIASTLETTGTAWPRLLRAGSVPLTLAALFAAAHSIQVI